MKFILIFLISFNTFAFFDWFSDKKEPYPTELETKEEQMNYLKNNNPELYHKMNKEIQIEQTNNKKIDIDQYSADYMINDNPYSNLTNDEKEKILKEEMLKREKEELSNYMVINGEVVKKEDYTRIQKEKQDKNNLNKNLKKFQKEMGLPQTKDGQALDIKDE